MLRRCLLAAALLSITVPAAAAERPGTSSWDGDRMRLTPRPRLPTFADELHGNCAGLTVTIKTRIAWLKTLEEKAVQQQWPPPSALESWARPQVDGDIARQRERIGQLNAALGAKGCQTVDVRTELQRATTIVEPGRKQKKKK